MKTEQLEYVDKLIDCFTNATIQEDGLIHLTPELREQIVLMLPELK